MKLPDPIQGQTYRSRIDHDGTKVGLINAMLDLLKTCPEGTNSISSVWDGELVVVTAEMLTGARN